MSRLTLKNRNTLISIFLVSVLIVTAMTSYLLPTHARPVHPGFNHFLSTQYNGDGQYDDNSPGGLTAAGPAQELYSDRAYPQQNVTYTQTLASYKAFLSLSKHNFATQHSSTMQGQSWRFIGPKTPNVPGVVTYTGRTTTVSGRVTAIAVSRSCEVDICRVWVGAAGGGVWRTDNGLAPQPDWHSSNSGLASNAIGSIIIDPTDATGRTLYLGTGEPNGSSDSEAGVGLYKSTDFGSTWTLVPGSVAAAKDRSIGAIAIDPNDDEHIFIGTDVARHGASSVNGGRFTPPDAPKIGLYESTDGGATFNLVFSKASDAVNPGSPTCSDFFRGGVSKLTFDNTGLATDHMRLYFSVFDYGVYRRLNNGTFEQVFASGGSGTVANSAGSRTEFALAPNGNKLRIYVGDTDGTVADFYRVDDANVPASTLTDGTKNPGWLKLSNSTKGTPGFASYNYCDPQCSYDMPIASPAGHPDSVWIGGSMQYAEVFTANPPSNGRAVQRSTDAGESFTDMTNDTQAPPLGMHPDQHFIAFAPGHPDIAFLGSDGGLVRTSGDFADASSDCDKRGLTGADLIDCKSWLKAIPTQIFSLNDGLATIQFQSLTFNPQHPHTDIMGGSQDNGTWSYDANQQPGHNWFESVGGDGGQSAIDYGNANIRMHTYYGPNGDINFKGTDPAGWDAVTDPLVASKEAASFYVPLTADPQISGTLFVGLEHIWRTVDDGGPQPYLDQHCNEQSGDFQSPCGDWVPLGGPTATLTGPTYGTDRDGGYVVAISRAAGDYSTLWTATRLGRLFISTNAAAPAASVTFTCLDTLAQPSRFISGIAVDPKNPYHAFVSYSGYNAYTPTTSGHVFDVTYDPKTGKAIWQDLSNDLGDAPITGIAYDDQTGNLYISSDFGVAVLQVNSRTWLSAAPGLSMVAVYSLSISSSGRVLYAATHGRGAWRLDLN
ncbi:MAG: exo-alpha-sialidase [Ktedonobacteraceae bacterium]